jgi:hypothetical protein
MAATVKYTYSGRYDDRAFAREYKTAFAGVQKYNEPSLPDLLFVLGKIGTDKRIMDVRWAAYILGTMFVESSHTVKVQKLIADNNGKVKTQTLKVWKTDYGSARDMVNPGASHANKVEVAKIAERFETVLFTSQLSAAPALQAVR